IQACKRRSNCTAVVGGSIHRAATKISTASDQRSATPMTNHLAKDRRTPFRSEFLVWMSGFSVTFQNNRLGSIDIVLDKSRQLSSSLLFREGFCRELRAHLGASRACNAFPPVSN